MKRYLVARSSGVRARRPKSAVERLPALASDEAWNVLTFVTDSIRHAEGKGALILGAAGAVGGVLYNLVASRAHPGAILSIATTICGISTVASGAFAALCLMPRLRHGDPPNSLVYFHHVARRHRGATGRAAYTSLFKTFSADSELLIEDLAAQIWANTHVARQKYRMASLGLAVILLAIGALAAATVIAAVQGPVLP